MFKLHCTRRVLLVDEDIALRTVLALLLAEEGYDVYQADNGEQAISLYGRRPLNLVVTELKLGGRDGFEVITEMQRELVCDRLIATGRSSWLPADLCTRAAEHFGAQCVLMKPFSPSQFLSAVRCVLRETDGHLHFFIPTIVVAASPRPLPAAMRTNRTFLTALSSGICVRTLRRRRLEMRRFL
jgi:two-component system, NtrC family, response regulator AtoC